MEQEQTIADITNRHLQTLDAYKNALKGKPELNLVLSAPCNESKRRTKVRRFCVSACPAGELALTDGWADAQKETESRVSHSKVVLFY